MDFIHALEHLKEHSQYQIELALAYPVKSLLREFVLPDDTRNLLQSHIHDSRLPSVLRQIEQATDDRNIPVKKAETFEASLHSMKFSRYFHRHQYYELDYIYRGRCRYYIESEQQAFVLEQGDLCLINQTVTHAIEPFNEDDTILKCFIPKDCVDPSLFKNLDQVSTVRHLLSGSMSQDDTFYAYVIFSLDETGPLEDILAKLILEYIGQPPIWQQAVRNWLSLMFVELVRREKTCDMLQQSTSSNRVMTEILVLMREQYQTVSLKSLAVQFHFQENYLSRLIRRETGESFSKLLAQIRLAEAERMLESTELTVSDIAGLIGYRNPAYLYKVFQRQHGLTPLQFRVRSKSGQRRSHI